MAQTRTEDKMTEDKMSPSASAVLQRNLRHAYPCAVSASGNYIVDSEQRRYFDASGGAAISCLGHGDSAAVRALCEQAERLDFAHTAFFTNDAAEELASYLCSRAPGDLSYAYFCCGGSEAMEAAFKLAHQYWQERGEGKTRRWLITRRQSYHGNTLGALSLGSNPQRRLPYAAILSEQATVSACDLYRGLGEGESEEGYATRLAAELEQKIEALGSQSVVAFVAETVSGSTLGAMPPAQGYWRRIREVCDRHGILLILDEVMCGSGRTGYRFACEEDGIAPDLLAMSKGLGGGLQPIGVTLASERIVSRLREGSGILRHGHSFMGHPIVCATALAVQRAIDERGLLAKVRNDGEALQEKLTAEVTRRPLLSRHVGDVRGRGLLRAVELVFDKSSKQPFPAALKVYRRVRDCAMARGLICYPSSGNADGASGDHVLLAPPFTLSEEELIFLTRTLCDALEDALKDALHECSDELA